MATSKLYWNGSAWSTSATYWVNDDSTASLGFGVISRIQIIAYDDATIMLKASLNPSVSDVSYSLSGTRMITSGGSSLLTLNDSNRNPSAVDVTSKTSFSYSGNVSVYRMAGGVTYGNASNISGSTTITSPFYTLTYNANGGSGAPSAATVCKGVAYALSTTKPTRTGYSFQGWATSSSATTASYAAGAAVNFSANTTLYAVWKAELTTISASNGTIGTALTITLTQQGSSYSYKHDVKWTINGTTQTIVSDKTGSSATITQSWTPAIATIVPLYADRKSYPCTLTVVTKTSSGTTLGSKTASITLAVPTSCAPTLSGSVSPTNKPSSFSNYVSGKSKAYFNYTATPQYSATIVSWKYVVNGATTTVTDSSTTKTYTSASAVTASPVKVIVTDSRGLSATAQTSITVSAYSAPSVTSPVLTRALPDGTVDGQGEYLKVTGTVAIKDLSNTNTKTWAVKYKLQSASTWTAASSGTLSSYSTSFSYLSSSAILSQSSTYDVRLEITDYYGTTIVQQTVSTAAAIIDFKADGKGVAFGKVSEVSNAVEIASDWDLIHNGVSLLDKVSKSGDTMTGELEVLGAQIHPRSTNVTSGTTVASNANGNSDIRFKDSADNTIAYVTPRFETDGTQKLRIATTRDVNGSTISSVVDLGIDSNGVRSVYLGSSASAWRTALGLSYAKNATVTLSDLAVNGYVTNSTARIYIGIPVPKSMENISTVTVTAMTGALRGGSGAIDSTGTSTDLYSNYTVTAVKSTDNMIRVYILKSSAFSNVTNNSPVSFAGSISLKFT